MPNPILKDNVFKFVSVRPPQQPSSDVLALRFVRYSETEKSSLHKSIAALDGKEDARNKAINLAKEFMTSDNYISSNKYWKNFQGLDKIEEILSKVSSPAVDEIAKAIEPVLKKKKVSDYTKTDEFIKLRDTLWNSLYANTLLVHERPQDRIDIFKGIRTIHLLQTIAGMESKHDAIVRWREIFKATPLLSKDLFPKQVKKLEKKDNRKDDPGADPGKIKEQLREKLSRLNDAINDIKEANRKLFLELSNQSKSVEEKLDQNLFNQRKSIKSSKAPATQPEKKLVPDLQVASPWKFGEMGRKYLRASTLVQLREHNTPLDTLTVPEIITSLEQEMSKITTLLFKDIEDNKIKKIGNVFVNTTGSSSNALMTVVPGSIRFPPLQGVGQYPNVPGVTVLGVGDLMIVEQTLLKYQAGEVAHIENIMLSEKRKRKHRRLNRTEESFLSETERTQETEKDLQSTERFELQRESENTIQSDSKMDAGVTVTGGFGPVTTTAHADFASSSSTSESNRTSTNYAKDVTERSVSRLKERVREERTRKTLEEIEEINIHGFDNTEGTGHVTGIYRWVDKIYLAQVVNYGRRLMLEFIIPEPAAFYLYAEDEGNKKVEGVTLTKPLDPETVGFIVGTDSKNFWPSDLHPWDYYFWIKYYKVQGVFPPPPLWIVVATTFEQAHTPGGTQLLTKANKELGIPEGYMALGGFASGLVRGDLEIRVGTNYNQFHYNGFSYFTLNQESKIVPVSVLADADAFVVNVEVTCERLDGTYQKWQLATYSAIINAYQKLKSDYDEQLNAARIRQGVQIAGRNPNLNREIEKEELKKGCLTFLARPFPPNTAFDQFGSIFDAGSQVYSQLYPQSPFNYPEIAIDEAASEGTTIQFMEQAFEWNQMTYLFYPYFWGRKENWVKTHQLEDTDPLFTKFQQAGAARVLVPVRLNYEPAVIHYLSTLLSRGTGEIWNGGEAPALDDDLFISIADEIKAQTGGDGGGTKVGEPWEVKVPTSLVYLDPVDSPLPDWS